MVGKKEFVSLVFDLNNKIFVVYVTFLINLNLSVKVYPFYRTQIAFLKADEALTSVLFKYTNYVDVFLKDLAIKLLKYSRINDHAINLAKSHQPSYKPIYNLGQVELKNFEDLHQNQFEQ